MHFFLPSTLEIILTKSKSKREREREGGRKKDRELQWDRECLRMQKYNNNKKEERSEADWRGERKQEREREGDREKEPDELLE